MGRLGDRPSAGRVLLYQLSIGSGVADIFRERRERKFVNYHNITPADLLEAWVPAVGEEVRWGRAQLRDLAPVTEFAIADSHVQRTRAPGGRLPVDDHRAAPHRPGRLRRRHPIPPWPAAWPRRRQHGGTDLLFVGKVSPHKGQHDLVKASAAYRRLYDPEARLHLVGGAISDEYGSWPSSASQPGARSCSTPWRSPVRSPTRS